MLDLYNMMLDMYNIMFETNNKDESPKKRTNWLKLSGIAVCLIGAFLMAWGDKIVGENHAGIATVIGILGIGMITNSNTLWHHVEG